MWGSRTRWNSKSNGTVSDEDLQAQAWLPSCLRALLAEVFSSFFLHHLFKPEEALCKASFQTGQLPLVGMSTSRTVHTEH